VWTIASPGTASHPLAAPAQRFFKAVNARLAVDNLWSRPSSILARRPSEKGARSSFSLTSYREADLSAERTPQEAEARIPRAHVDAGRPRDPEATQGPGPQAAFGLTPPAFALLKFKWIDRSVPTDVQAKPERPDVGTASGASIAS